jgi:hypothetical protein
VRLSLATSSTACRLAIGPRSFPLFKAPIALLLLVARFLANVVPLLLKGQKRLCRYA